jgi:hypothetical protein
LGMYHNCNVIIVDTVVVDWRLQEIGVLLEPAGLLAKPIPYGDNSPTTLEDSEE